MTTFSSQCYSAISSNDRPFGCPIIYTHIFTAHKRNLGQGNIFAPVCHSVHRGEYLGRYPLAGTPPGRYSPQAGTPRTGTLPGQVHIANRYTPNGQVHPPDRYTPLGAVHAGRYGQQAGSMHPTGMHSCFTMLFCSLTPPTMHNTSHIIL